MPMICIQCSMRALLNDEQPPMFEESNEEHMRRCHPDLEATRQERIELEKKLAIKLKGGK